MTSKERVLASLSHLEPDRVPLFYRDVPEVDDRLRRDLGLEDREDLYRYFDIDFRWVGPEYVGPPLVEPATGRQRSIWGVEYRYLEAAHGGYWEPVEFPFASVEDSAALADHPWPMIEWFDFSVVDEQLQRHRDYATMTAPGWSSPGILTTIQDLCGMEKTLMDLYANPDLWNAVADRVVSFNLEFIDALYAAAGERIDFYRIGDDFGTQRGLLIGADLWKEFLAPRIRSLVQVPKARGSHYYHHTCGAVREIIPLLIEAGVDVLDPVQVGATGMNPGVLKGEFGSRLCFSGGIDEQRVLPSGTPQQVKDEVRRMCDIMAPGGGYFVGPTHNLQDDIPTANVVAMYEAAREWTYR